MTGEVPVEAAAELGKEEGGWSEFAACVEVLTGDGFWDGIMCDAVGGVGGREIFIEVWRGVTDV